MLSKAQMTTWARGFCRGELPHDVLRDKRPHSVVARLRPEGEPSVILKLWNKPGLKGVLRKITRTDPLSKEVRVLRLFQQSAIRVPKILGYCQFSDRSLPGTGALFLEDLGSCALALEHVKALIRDGKEAELEAFEADVLDITQKLVRARLIDADHTFVNLVVDPAGTLYRLDYEIARRVLSVSLANKAYGTMLGRLLASYTFAVQPDVPRTYDFARRVIDALHPSRRALRHAEAYVGQAMDVQHAIVGIRTEVSFPW